MISLCLMLNFNNPKAIISFQSLVLKSINPERKLEQEFHCMGFQCWTRVVTNSFKHCSHSSLHSSLCARRGNYASIWCHCCIKYSKCESLKQFHWKAPPGVLEYRVYHKSYAKCKQDKWHGMHVSNFTKNTAWKEQIISLFENTFRKRLSAIKTYCPLRCDVEKCQCFRETCYSLFCPRDGGSRLVQNVGTFASDYTMSHPRRKNPLYSPVWEPQYSTHFSPCA